MKNLQIEKFKVYRKETLCSFVLNKIKKYTIKHQLVYETVRY